VLAVALTSGKGGTGKSVVAASVIQELAKRGRKVGAIDADFSNPNLRRLLQINAELKITQDKKLLPASQNGVSFFTIEQVIRDKGVGMSADEYAEIMRDVIENGIWDVDYMVIDLPAIISNEFRAVLAIFEDNYLGSLIIAQPAHLQTTERVFKLHELNGIPVLGVVENMVSFTCEHGVTYELFGSSGIDALASQYGVKVLGKIPLSMEIQRQIQDNVPVKIPQQDVVNAVVDEILASKPKTIGFVQEVKRKVKQVSRDTLFRAMKKSIEIINSQIDITAIQQKYHYPGGQNIGLVIMDEKGENIIERMNFRIENGKLYWVKEPEKVDAWIYIKGIALGWALLGKKKFPDGHEVNYDIMDAWLNGDATVYGSGSVTRAIDFFRTVWNEATPRLSPSLEPIIRSMM